MKTIATIIAVLMLPVGFSAAEDKKPDSSGESLLTVPTQGKPVRLTLRQEAPNEMVMKKVTLKGPLIALAKSERPLHTFNPFTPARNGSESEAFKSDPYVGRPRGIVLFSIGF